LRTALVKPAKNNAANTHASTRSTQWAADSQAGLPRRLARMKRVAGRPLPVLSGWRSMGA